MGRGGRVGDCHVDVASRTRLEWVVSELSVEGSVSIRVKRGRLVGPGACVRSSSMSVLGQLHQNHAEGA